MNVLSRILASRGKDYSADIPHLTRRICKLSEEAGELAQAFLDWTSKTPKRGKTAEDVLEEACDSAIVALDIALCAAGNNEDAVHQMLARKLDRWKARNNSKLAVLQELPKGCCKQQ